MFRIQLDGTLDLPYGIQIQTTGLAEPELKDRVRNAYRRYFRNTSIIDVAIAQEEFWVDVRGLVRRAGAYLARRDSSLDELIGKAGGFVDSPTPQYVRIHQGGTTTVIKLSEYYSGAQGMLPEWRGGDSVFFQSEPVHTASPDELVEKNYIQLLGEVTSPGEYRIKEGADFFYYLVRAAGPTSNADMDNIQVVRRTGFKVESLTFSTDDVDEIPGLMGGDIVIVNPQSESDLTIASGFVGILSSITSIFALLLI